MLVKNIDLRINTSREVAKIPLSSAEDISSFRDEGNTKKPTTLEKNTSEIEIQLPLNAFWKSHFHFGLVLVLI